MAHTLGVKNTLKKNTMLIALVVVMFLFQFLIVSFNKGSLFNPANISNIISQNAYVVILASGMLLCILTGGNIDLSVGSIVSLVGAIAGTMIVTMGMNIYVGMAIALLCGIAIGAWQGFWIAYIRIPPFIVTLAGMLLWRGLAMTILNGLTISPFPDNYLKYFTSYLPGDANATTIFNITMIVSFVVCGLFIVLQILDRITKKKKGYDVEPMVFMIIKVVIISVVVLLIGWFLAQHKGIPVVLILLTVIVLVYSYFTKKNSSRTTSLCSGWQRKGRETVRYRYKQGIVLRLHEHGFPFGSSRTGQYCPVQFCIPCRGYEL